jgi:hypothetical protein
MQVIGMKPLRVTLFVLASLVCVTFLAMVAAGLAGRAHMVAGPAPTAEVAVAPSAPGMEADKAASSGETPSGGEALAPLASSVAYAAAERKMIRTAEVRVEVEDAEKTLQECENLARQYAGFVGNTSVSRHSDGGKAGSATIRVPVARYDEALAKVRGLGKVESISSRVQDVTAEFVDLQARLRNAQREEQEITKLFDRGGKLGDIIQIETKLSSVREKIEQMQGQMRVLSDQIDLCTITVTFYEKGEAAVAATGKFNLAYHLRSAVRALILVLRGLLTALVYVIVVGWVIWLPILLLVVLARRRSGRGNMS